MLMDLRLHGLRLRAKFAGVNWKYQRHIGLDKYAYCVGYESAANSKHLRLHFVALMPWGRSRSGLNENAGQENDGRSFYMCKK